MSDRILVTGGAGFIGGVLVQLLLTRGDEIHVIDHSIDTHSLFSQKKLKSQITYHDIDIRSRDKTHDTIQTINPTAIIHLAAEAIVERSYENPLDAIETNVMGTAHVLEAARHLSQILGIIVASTDKSYGKSDTAYVEDTPLKPDHPYDASKASCDLIAQTYAQTYELPITISRFGNVYGPGDFNWGRIMPDICRAIIDRKKLRLRSDGTYVRDYVYVEDVARAYLFLLEHMSECAGEVYNVSSSDSFSVLDLITRIETELDVKIPYSIENTAHNEIPYQHLDDTKIRKLGWTNTHSFAEGIKKTFAWYTSVLS